MNTTNKEKQRRKANVVAQPVNFIKVPPQARDLEEAVLGAIMLEKDAYDVASKLLKVDCFYVNANRRVFRAMDRLSLRNDPIDILTVIEELQKWGDLEAVGGQYYVTRLTNSVVSSANIEAHCRIVLQKYVQREVIRISTEAINEGYEESTDAFELLEDTQKKLSDISDSSAQGEARHISDLVVERMQRLMVLGERENHITGVDTGFKNINDLTGGWQSSDLIILAARPGVGKTALALNLARNAAASTISKVPVYFQSLEMSAGQLADRMMSSEAAIPLQQIVMAKMGNVNMDLLYVNGVQKLAGYDIYIDDSAALNIMQLRSRVRRAKKLFGIGLVIIDYLQLMSGTAEHRGNREQEISTISRSLKALAKEENIPIIALSQLSRQIENRSGNDPQLSDLRESGAIEQDADVVFFATRPSYNTPKPKPGEPDPEDTIPYFKDKGDLHFKKHRNGTLAHLEMYAVLEIQRWMTSDQFHLHQLNSDTLRTVHRSEPKKDDPF